jgi:hypothetical protein
MPNHAVLHLSFEKRKERLRHKAIDAPKSSLSLGGIRLTG